MTDIPEYETHRLQFRQDVIEAIRNYGDYIPDAVKAEAESFTVEWVGMYRGEVSMTIRLCGKTFDYHTADKRLVPDI